MNTGILEEQERNGSSTVLYQQLRSEYNELLKRYAQAENTIDQLRTGARIHLYTDPQDVKPSDCGDSKNVRHGQRINLPCPSQAVVSSVTARNDTGMKSTGGHDRRDFPEIEKIQGSSPLSNTKEDENLPRRIQSLKENVDSFENYLRESDVTPTTMNEVSNICKQLDEEHKELCRELKTCKHSQLSPSSQSDTVCQDLEKELYRIGLRIKEIQQEVSRRDKAGKASHFNFNQTQQTEEPIISPKSKGVSAFDPDLENLLKKLKDLQDASVRNNKEILSSCRLDRSKDSSCEGLPNEPRRGRFSSSPHSESHDVVDARYFAASPVLPEYYETDEENEDEQQYATGVDHIITENEETFEEAPNTVKNTRTFDLNANDVPSQPKKPSSSDADRHRAASFDKSRQPTNRNHRESYSDGADHDSGEHSRPLSPRSDPENETCHENFASQIAESSPNKHDHSRRNKAEKNATPDKDQRRKSSSMSSLVESSRMSTPLFRPRGKTRVSPALDHRGAGHKRRNPADGFDSGFVGSEESRSSRMTAESPDIMRKLNLSNTWDSNLHLDLVSEIDENDSATSQAELSTTYEHVTEHARRLRSPAVVDRTPRDTAESTLVNSSPSPPSSPDRTRRKPAMYFGHSTSYSTKKRSSSESSLPVTHVRLADPSLSRISEKTSSDRSSRIERTSGASRDIKGRLGEYSRTGFREALRNVNEDPGGLKPRKLRESESEKRTNVADKKERVSLLTLRHDINRLRNQIKNLLNEPRVTLDMYDDLRRQDEQLRKILESKNEQTHDELRDSIDRLTKDRGKPRQTQTLDRNSYDDLRSQVKNLTEKLDELSELRRFTERSPISHEDGIGQRFHGLVRKVEELRLRVENDTKQDTRRPERYICHLCDEAACDHHGYNPAFTKQPQTSTPLLSGIYETSRRQPTIQEPENQYAKSPTYRHLSSTYPGARSPVIHHVHTYHGTPRRVNEKQETESSSEEDLLTRRRRHRKRPSRRLQQRRQVGGHDEHLALDEASHAARDVQRLSKNILNSISLDLASFRS